MKVVELATLFPGPLAGRLLMNFGFKVVKVEPPGGDPMREISPTFYKAVNSGKEVVFIDLKAEVEKIYRIVADATVVITTFRPKTAEKLGISYQKLKTVNPSLVYIAIVGFEGREYARDHPSHDINFAAVAGAIGKCPPVVQAVDVLTGVLAAFVAAGMALSGKAGYVEIPMSRAAALLNVLNYSLRRDSKDLFLSGDYPFYGIYRCRGGAVALGAVEPKFWERFCQAIGRPDLVGRMFDPSAREEVQKTLIAMDCGELEATAVRLEIPITPMRNIDEALKYFDIEDLLNLVKF